VDLGHSPDHRGGVNRRWIAAGLLLPLLAGSASATPPRPQVAALHTWPAARGTPGGTELYSAPVAGRVVVVNPFEAPPTPYAAGHRGVDLLAAPAMTVLAAGAGVVRFAGPVAGRGVIVVVHPDGVSTEYEPVAPLVAAGATVTRGQPIGQVHGRHNDCQPDRCLHWGARRNGEYFDPMLLLRPLGPVRLLPWP
jgi:murein DD-endopeptidase MepM/ murein hydrolase activator NlpD